MQTKPLLYGLIGFFVGGLLVAIAATTFDKPETKTSDSTQSTEMSMSDMTASLRDKTGDDYDETFINYMTEHHQSAVDMAKLSAKNAKHEEIKKLSNDIVAAQEQEMSEMRLWQTQWGYSMTTDHGSMNH